MSAVVDLGREDKRLLLRLARASLHEAAAGRPAPRAQTLHDDGFAAPLLQPRGVFVSLHTRSSHRLRGCIGCLEPRHPLVEAVIENAHASATRDPRFDPVRPDEVEQLEIEISVLGPMLDVNDAREIQVGRDGVGVSQNGRRGVLLPQVPVQLGWDRDTLLENVCLKAELPADAWRRGAAIQRFEAAVFSESLTPSSTDAES